MNPLTAVSGLLAVSVLSPGQGPPVQTKLTKASYHFRALHAGVQIGDANYERISSKTDRRILLTVNETVDGVTLSAIFDTYTKHDGTPEKKLFHGLIGSAPFSHTAVFTDAGVEFTVQDGKGESQTGTIKRPPNVVVADSSEAWFDTAIPKKGDSVSFTNFNVNNAKWEMTTTTYMGDESIKIGTKPPVSTHHVHVKSDGGEIEMYLDDGGDIVVLDEVGTLRLERAD